MGVLHVELFCTFSDRDSAISLQWKLHPTLPLFVYTEPVSDSPVTVACGEGCCFLGGSSQKTQSGGLRVTLPSDRLQDDNNFSKYKFCIFFLIQVATPYYHITVVRSCNFALWVEVLDISVLFHKWINCLVNRLWTQSNHHLMFCAAVLPLHTDILFPLMQLCHYLYS